MAESRSSDECATCLGMNHECPDHESPGPDDGVERWRNIGGGVCPGCERKVANLFSRGQRGACVTCLSAAWGMRA